MFTYQMYYACLFDACQSASWICVLHCVHVFSTCDMMSGVADPAGIVLSQKAIRPLAADGPRCIRLDSVPRTIDHRLGCSELASIASYQTGFPKQV